MNLKFIWTEQGEEPTEKYFPWREKSKSSKFNWIMYTIWEDLQELAANTVHALNGLKGSTVEIVAGDNVSITTFPAQNQIQIAATAGSAGPHLHTGMGWEARSTEFVGEKRGCAVLNGYLWVTGYNSQAMANKIHKYDPSTLELIDTLDSPSQVPWGLCTDGQYLYEADSDYKNRIYRIDPDTAESTLITLGTSTDGYLYGIAYDTASQKFWLTDSAKCIYCYSQDLQTQEVKEALPHGNNPTGLTYDFDRDWLWISFIWDYNFQHVLAFTTALLPRVRMEAIGEWYGIVYDASSNRFYGSCRYADQKFRIFRTLELKSVI